MRRGGNYFTYLPPINNNNTHCITIYRYYFFNTTTIYKSRTSKKKPSPSDDVARRVRFSDDEVEVKRIRKHFACGVLNCTNFGTDNKMETHCRN